MISALVLIAAAALALETDDQLCAQAIADAQAQLDGLEYNEDKSYAENCAAADAIISALAARLAELRTGTPDFSGFKIKNYNSKLSVDYKSTVIFHTTMEAPEGYEIVWSNGAKGSECKLSTVTDKEYRISAKMVNKTTGKTEAETEEVIVTVNTGFFAKIIAFFKGLFGSLPTYEDFKKK